MKLLLHTVIIASFSTSAMSEYVGLSFEYEDAGNDSFGGFLGCGVLFIIVGLFFFLVDKTRTDEEREFTNKLNSLISSCSYDERRTQRLISDPLVFLAAHGIDLPEGVQFTFTVQNKTLRTIKISHPDPKLTKTILQQGTWFGID